MDLVAPRRVRARRATRGRRADVRVGARLYDEVYEETAPAHAGMVERAAAHVNRVVRNAHLVVGLGSTAVPAGGRRLEGGSAGEVGAALDPAVAEPDFGALHPGPLSKPVALHWWM